MSNEATWQTDGLVPTAYDTAWVASIRQPVAALESMFPGSLKWLLDNQLADGSWGGAVRYQHDRILSTLAAVGTLAGYPSTTRVESAITDGVRYLWQYGHQLKSEPVELVGFEVLLASLIERAQRSGVHVPPHLDIYGEQRKAKLRLIPPEMLYSPKATISHSLEFLGNNADPDKLRNAQSSNGSIGNAPAATSLFVSLTGDASAISYLEGCMDASGGAAVPVLYPCDTYESLWSAYQLRLAGARSVLGSKERMRLRACLANTGVSLAPTFPAADADETSVALLLMREAGEKTDPEVLQQFETSEGHFASFPFERHPSVGVNVHVLHALLQFPEYPDGAGVINRLLDYLEATQEDGMWWTDKWHISPFYATSHVAGVFAELPLGLKCRVEPAMARMTDWLIETQNREGSWGFYDTPTIEETAYAVTGLWALAPASHSATRAREAASRGTAYLAARVSDPQRIPDEMMPPLWIDKCLYTPRSVVKAAVAGALSLSTSKSQELRGVA